MPEMQEFFSAYSPENKIPTLLSCTHLLRSYASVFLANPWISGRQESLGTVADFAWNTQADIKGFFDNADGDQLMGFLEHCIADKSVLCHIKHF